MTAETVAADQRDPLPKAPGKRKPKRRKPVRRFMIVTHRWLSLILDVVLIVICTTGAILVLDPQIHHALNSRAFAASGGAVHVTMQQAKDAVRQAHPDFAPTAVIEASGVLSVTDYTTAWNVDPSTGAILGGGEGNPRVVEVHRERARMLPDLRGLSRIRPGVERQDPAHRVAEFGG